MSAAVPYTCTTIGPLPTGRLKMRYGDCSCKPLVAMEGEANNAVRLWISHWRNGGNGEIMIDNCKVTFGTVADQVRRQSKANRALYLDQTLKIRLFRY